MTCHCVICRYEIELEGNRNATATEIGRRFLGIDEEIKAIDQDSDKLESNNLNNVTSPKNNQITTSSENEKVGDGDENADLVLDILNDELIAQVRLKVHSEYSKHAAGPWILIQISIL